MTNFAGIEKGGFRGSGGHWLSLPAVVLGTVLSLLSANPAAAFVFAIPAPSYRDVVTFGQTFPAAIAITNASTPPSRGAAGDHHFRTGGGAQPNPHEQG